MSGIRLTIRRLALVGSGLTFGAIALASLVAPGRVAAQYAYTFDSPGAYNEFHAVFTGFWLGLFVLMVTAARRPEDQRLGDLCGIAVGLQALGRLFSVVAHGAPPASFIAAMLGELVTAAAILQSRDNA